MTDFIREVDEEVRHDQLKRFFQRYWIVFAALALLLLAGVGAWQAYDYLRTGKAEASGGRYLDALDLARDGKTDDAVAGLRSVAADGAGGYRLLARLRLAAAVGSKDAAGGVKLFDELATDPALDPAIRNIVRLRAATLLLDTTSYPDLKARLEPLTDANSPVRNAARELLALAALKVDMNEDAGRALDAIESDPTTTAQLRQRADALQGLIRGAGRQQAGAAPAPNPTSSSTPVAPVALPPEAAPAPASPSVRDPAPAPAEQPVK